MLPNTGVWNEATTSIEAEDVAAAADDVAAAIDDVAHPIEAEARAIFASSRCVCAACVDAARARSVWNTER